MQTGKIQSVFFGNVTAVSEGGLVISGHPGSTIEGVTVKGATLDLKKLTAASAGHFDFRPSAEGLVNTSAVPAVFLEFVNHVKLINLEVCFLWIWLCSLSVISGEVSCSGQKFSCANVLLVR